MVAASVYLLLSLWLLAVVLKLEFPRLYPVGLDEGGGFAAMFFVWFIPHFFVLGLVSTGVTAALGGLEPLAGQLGLGIHLLCWSVMLRHQLLMPKRTFLLDGQPLSYQKPPFSEDLASPQLLENGQALALLKRPGAQSQGEGALTTVPMTAYLTQRHPGRGQVQRLANIPYRTVDGVTLRLNVYRSREVTIPAAPEQLRPAVMVIHGGGWVIGTRDQFHRTCIELAMDGFVVFAISYRLAPRFALPAAVHDCKAAIVWIKQHGASYGARPDFITVMGGSAGGHLTALMALTPNERRFQPGFEEADTRVQAAIPLYGVMDFATAVEHGKHPILKALLERVVIKVPQPQDPGLYQLLEPLKQSPDKAPPMLMVHGAYDRMVSPNDSRQLAARLQAVVGARAQLLEVPNAPHAFDIFLNPLQQRSNWVIRHFLHRTYRDFLRQNSASQVA